jgi:hypothetical protein
MSMYDAICSPLLRRFENGTTMTMPDADSAMPPILKGHFRCPVELKRHPMTPSDAIGQAGHDADGVQGHAKGFRLTGGHGVISFLRRLASSSRALPVARISWCRRVGPQNQWHLRALCSSRFGVQLDHQPVRPEQALVLMRGMRVDTQAVSGRGHDDTSVVMRFGTTSLSRDRRMARRLSLMASSSSLSSCCC